MKPVAAHWLWVGLASILLIGQPAVAAEQTNRNLVTVEWLRNNLQRGDILVIDASPPKVHAAAHIPGAINVDVFSFGGREIPDIEMEGRMRSWGVSGDKEVVLYDPGGTYFATSLFFDLYYYGFPPERLRILDGGLAKWRASGGAITKEPTPLPRLGTFHVEHRNENARVLLPEFIVASGDPASNVLVEALEPSQHFGGTKFFDRAGHIPNAIMLPNADLFNADKTFKSAPEIQQMLGYLGIKREQQVYTHCGGGIAASVPFFAAKFMLDYPHVKLYKGSQLEWLRDDRGLPLWTYDAPNLTRDKNWLNGWGNQMIRSFGVAKLSVVDVRSPALFEQGHVPFAINVPAELFKRHVASPAKLAEALGAAGVDVTDEAVIVSAGGLNPDSAVAFLMLQKLGQKRVSVLSDSVDDWAFAGLPLSKGQAQYSASARTAERGPATVYPLELRSDTDINDTGTTYGSYSKVYIASGQSLPTKMPTGTLIHVPYTDFIDNGKPKPANEIWNILVKAGVPRYAELITIADDPGEAAANYFILKLMGYPDVKVLM